MLLALLFGRARIVEGAVHYHRRRLNHVWIWGWNGDGRSHISLEIVANDEPIGHHMMSKHEYGISPPVIIMN